MTDIFHDLPAGRDPAAALPEHLDRATVEWCYEEITRLYYEPFPEPCGNPPCAGEAFALLQDRFKAVHDALPVARASEPPADPAALPEPIAWLVFRDNGARTLSFDMPLDARTVVALYDETTVDALLALGRAASTTTAGEFHAPGIGEVHNRAHNVVAYAVRSGDDGQEVPDDEFARQIVCALNAPAPSGQAVAPSDPPVSAMQALKAALQADPDYAWSWHCNLAMPIMDSIHCDSWQANKAAADLMCHLFGIDTRKHPHWKHDEPDKSRRIQWATAEAALWTALGQWSSEICRPDAELAPPQYLLDAVKGMKEYIAAEAVAPQPVGYITPDELAELESGSDAKVMSLQTNLYAYSIPIFLAPSPAVSADEREAFTVWDDDPDESDVRAATRETNHNVEGYGLAAFRAGAKWQAARAALNAKGAT